MTPCHSQKYAEALTGMQEWASRMWQGSLPPWGQAAMEQHAHYYAAQACGENTMRMSNYGAMAALGITRVGGSDGIVRQISMAGFGAPPPADAAGTSSMVSSNWLNEGCTRAAIGSSPSSSFCLCMYGDKDKISSDKKNHEDFQSWSPRWACQLTAEVVGNSWSDKSLFLQIMLSGGKADPFKGLPLAERIKAYKSLFKNLGDEEYGIPGIASFKVKDAGPQLEAWGLVPAGTFAAADSATSAVLNTSAYAAQVKARSDKDLSAMIAQFQATVPDPVTNAENAAVYAAAVVENNYRAANPCPPGQVRTTRFGLDSEGRAKCDQVSVRPVIGGGAAIIGLRPEPLPYLNLPGTGGGGGTGGTGTGGSTAASKPNTALLIGGGVAVIAALFLLKK